MLRYVRGTPGGLRAAMTAVGLAGLAFGALAFLGLTSRADAVARARAETADLVRLRTVESKLVVADAAAGVDVLLGPDQVRLTPHDYDDALQPAVLGVPLASARGRDAFPLAVANLRLTQYAGRVATARTLARQGDPRSVDEWRAAADLLRSDVLPRLRAVEAGSDARLTEDRSAAARGPLALLAGTLAGLLVTAGAHAWVSVRTRRILNLGVAAGLVLVTVTTVVSVVVVLRSDGHLSEVQNRSARVVDPLVAARQAAFDARAVEALGVATGDTSGADATWRGSIARARSSLAAVGGEADVADAVGRINGSNGFLDQYATVHRRLVDAANRGDRAGAARIAVDPTVDGSVGSFEDVDVTSGALLARQVQHLDDGLTEAGRNLRLAAWACLLAGIAAAGLGWAGLLGRLREYG